MVFLGLRFKGLLGRAVISYTSCNEIAGLIFGKRAIFYYPPGCKKGWTLKRIVVVSLFCYLAWSLVFRVAEVFVMGLYLSSY